MTDMFTWTSPAGAEINLPPMKSIKTGVLRKYRKLEAVDAAFSIIEAVADEATLEQIDELGSDDLNDLLSKWQEDVSLGESLRSSP